MNCPKCGAPMHVYGDSLRCDFCHTIEVPDEGDDGVRNLVEATDKSCPICTTALSKATLDQTPILYCTTCRGMAIPMLAFQALVQNERFRPSPVVPPNPTTSDLNRHIPCPSCHHPMEAHFYCGGPGNVVIDTCENCLLNWLDYNELNRIAHGTDSFENSSLRLQNSEQPTSPWLT